MTKPGGNHLRCPSHRRGIEPGTPPFFIEWCLSCQANKAAGKVTGKEGPPKPQRRWRDYLSMEAKMRAKKAEPKLPFYETRERRFR